MSLMDFGLRFEGVPEDTIADLDAHLPHIQRLVTAFKQAEPILTKMMPLINQLAPILQKAWPDIVAVTPLVRALTTFVEQKEKES